MRKFSVVLIVLWCLGNAHANAQSARVTRVLQQLQLKLEQCKESLIVEKKLPGVLNRFVVVIPKIADSSDDDFFELDSYILLTDSAGTILSQYFEDHDTNGWTSDALRLETITIDTAPYLVKPGLRAFGITVSFVGSSHANPFSSDVRSLFVPDGKRLKCLLNQLELNSEQGEWDTRCAGTFTLQEKAIAVAATTTKGYYDLMITNKITHSTAYEVGGDCKERSTSRVQRNVMKYGNHGYR